MQTRAIHQQVTKATKHEKRTGTLANLIRQYAELQGAHPSAADIAGVVSFVQEYVKCAPSLLESLDKAAQKADVSNEVSPILTAAVQYFLAPIDLIPDRMGLFGLMDDAYLAHSLVQAVSENYRQRTGTPLLPHSMDLTKANQMIRALIGEPIASQLDAAVAATLGMPSIQQALGQFPVLGSPLPMDFEGPVTSEIRGMAAAEGISLDF